MTPVTKDHLTYKTNLSALYLFLLLSYKPGTAVISFTVSDITHTITVWQLRSGNELIFPSIIMKNYSIVT